MLTTVQRLPNHLYSKLMGCDYSLLHLRSETSHMIRTKIVTYNKNKLTTFEEQINEVLEGIQTESNKEYKTYYVQDIKVINEHKVLIIYR